MAITKNVLEQSVSQYDPNINIHLLEHQLWEKFYYTGNEMIVTRNGRKMFPLVKILVDGLDESAMYSLVLQFLQNNIDKWKYQNAEWSTLGKPDEPHSKNFYCHEDSPNYGSHWMSGTIMFNKMKLTNKEVSADQVRLNSLHQYIPVLKIFKVYQSVSMPVHELKLELCKFIAVTAYQNENITCLKIKYNPFAKAFQESKERATRGRSESCDQQFDGESREICGQQQYSNYNYHQPQLMHMMDYGQPYATHFQRQGANGLHPHRMVPYASPNPAAFPFNNYGAESQLSGYNFPGNYPQSQNYLMGSYNYDLTAWQNNQANYVFQGFVNGRFGHMQNFIHMYNNERNGNNPLSSKEYICSDEHGSKQEEPLPESDNSKVEKGDSSEQQSNYPNEGRSGTETFDRMAPNSIDLNEKWRNSFTSIPNYYYPGYQNNVAVHTHQMPSHYGPMMYHHYPMNHVKQVSPHECKDDGHISGSPEDVSSSLIVNHTEKESSTGSSPPNSTDSSTTSNISYQDIDFYTSF